MGLNEGCMVGSKVGLFDKVGDSFEGLRVG